MNIESLEHRTLFAAGPTPSLKISPRAPGPTSGSIQFIVTYSDPNGIDPGSIDNRDIRLYGPNGYGKYPIPFTATSNADGTVRTIRYKLGAPGGTWNAADNGTYTVRMRGGGTDIGLDDGVADLQGNFTKAALLGKFVVKITDAAGGAPANQQAFHANAFSSTSITGSDANSDRDPLSDLSSL